MPKKKKGGKKKGGESDSADAKDKDVDKKSYEPPRASEKEIALRTECVEKTTPFLYNAHHHSLLCPVSFRLQELDNELDTLKKQVSDLYPCQLL